MKCNFYFNALTDQHKLHFFTSLSTFFIKSTLLIRDQVQTTNSTSLIIMFFIVPIRKVRQFHKMAQQNGIVGINKGIKSGSFKYFSIYILLIYSKQTSSVINYQNVMHQLLPDSQGINNKKISSTVKFKNFLCCLQYTTVGHHIAPL